MIKRKNEGIILKPNDHLIIYKLKVASAKYAAKVQYLNIILLYSATKRIYLFLFWTKINRKCKNSYMLAAALNC